MIKMFKSSYFDNKVEEIEVEKETQFYVIIKGKRVSKYGMESYFETMDEALKFIKRQHLEGIENGKKMMEAWENRLLEFYTKYPQASDLTDEEEESGGTADDGLFNLHEFVGFPLKVVDKYFYKKGWSGVQVEDSKGQSVWYSPKIGKTVIAKIGLLVNESGGADSVVKEIWHKQGHYYD